ncbi:MAG: hypothetical protein KAQ98_12430 [Bacteriovoracaceae bacterium]|nr:hypothetical protein [Bacteriovoracaceae bacterium]
MKKNRLTYIFMAFILTSCLSTSGGNKRESSTSQITNNASTVNAYNGRVLRDNPIILSGNNNLSPTMDIGTLLTHEQDYITNQNTLIGFCKSIEDSNSPCYRILENQYSTPLTSTDYKWAYTAGTSEFDQVHTFYHVGKIVENFQSNLESYYNGVHLDDFGFPKAPPYTTAIPSTLYSQLGHWDKNKTLEGYSWAQVENNACFSPTDFTVHLGYLKDYPSVRFAHDPSIIYHETGHALVKVMMNMRNTAYGSNVAPIKESELGYLQYDEAGAINEGIADFTAHSINQRSRFSEWILGILSLSRPLSEDDTLHIAGISKDSTSRLSYPTYLNYEPNDPSFVIEDIHNAGMITSHLLVAIVDDLMSKCYITDRNSAIKLVFQIMTETLSELGDFTATGNNNNDFTINLNYNHSWEWARISKPINYYTFYQTMARKLLTVLGSNLRCNGHNYSQDDIERLFDSYGLLLFQNYNEDGGGAITGHTGTNTEVNVANRLKSILLSKDKVKLDPSDGASQAFIFDGREDMRNALKELTGSLQVSDVSPFIDPSLPYNNGNGKISPGELIGLALNLHNDSNTPIGGVHVLANDWDHFKNEKPCNTLGDSFPLASEGAADSSSESNPSNTAGDCNYITRDNGDEQDEELYPTCFVEISEDDSTKWVSQEKLRQKINLEQHKCLSGDSSRTKDCFLRALKGADQAFYSKIDPNTTWASTLSNDGEPPVFNFSNIIFFEVSEWIPPGTTFNCRFRVRFTNCSDCFTDTSRDDMDDYLDYEFSGAKPYKLINLQFTVID